MYTDFGTLARTDTHKLRCRVDVLNHGLELLTSCSRARAADKLRC